jgi:TonB family protein
MRRMILTSLVLIPVLAHAQSSTSTEPRPSTSSAMVQAELIVPASPVELAMAAASRAVVTPAAVPAAAISAANLAGNAAIRQFVMTRTMDDFTSAALRQGGSLEFALLGGLPTQASTPQLIRAVEVQLTSREMDNQPTVSQVVVHAMVDAYGYPRNVSVAQSAGSVLDKKAIAAVNQYRFKPATRDNKPVDSAVMITIKIQKP